MPDPTFRFDPTAHGPAVAAVLGDGRRLAPLGPRTPDERFRPAIAALDVPATVRAGVWLYHDFWHEAHEVAQEVDTPDGSFWHAVLHRREPDPGNAKYWCRRIGPHPVLAALAEHSPDLGYPFTNPLHFVDFCETHRGTGGPEEDTARRVQLLEWQLLFAHCHRG